MVAQARGVKFGALLGDGSRYPVKPEEAYQALRDVAAWLRFRLIDNFPTETYFRALPRYGPAIFKRATRARARSARPSKRASVRKAGA